MGGSVRVKTIDASSPFTSSINPGTPGELAIFQSTGLLGGSFLQVSFTVTNTNTLTIIAGAGGAFTITCANGLNLTGSGGSQLTLAASGSLTSTFGFRIVGLGINNVNKTANYTATAQDDYISCTGGAAFTVTLPVTGLPLGKIYIVKNKTSPLATITVSSTANIDGAASQTITTANQVIRVLWDGTTYNII